MNNLATEQKKNPLANTVTQIECQLLSHTFIEEDDATLILCGAK